MNIALFSDSYYPTKSGVVTVVTQLREQLQKKGHNVILVTVATSIEYENYDPGIYRVTSFPLGLGTDQYFGIPNMRDLVGFLRNQNIEIIHCHTEFNVGKSGQRAAKILKIPCIITTHTMWEDFYKFYLPFAKIIPKDLIRHWVKKLYGKYHAFINVSTKARNYFKSDFMLPQIPSAVIPNAIDKSRFQSKRLSAHEIDQVKNEYGIQKQEKVLLFVGRIAEEKRVFELLQICACVLEKTNGYKAIFVGNGPALEELKKKAKNLSVHQKILFTGYIDWEKVHTFYDSANIFITASLSEMHSMTVLEASLCALPIVARKDESYLDTILHGQNGFLAGTDEQMADFLLELMNDEQKCRRFGEYSVEVSKRFTIESHTQKTIAFYKEVINAYPAKPDESALIKAVE